MSAVMDAYLAVGKALRVMPGLTVARPGDNFDPPTAVPLPPAFEWQAQCPDPTTAQLIVMVVVPKDEASLDRLLSLAPRVAAAIEQNAGLDAVVTRADPAAYQTGSAELPAYALSVEVSL